MFDSPRYVGDPLNAIRIFNEQCADELILLDIGATSMNTRPDLEIISKCAEECFMPFCYGGGVNSLKTISEILKLGVEKVSIGSHAVYEPHFVKEAADEFGSQSIVVCIDVKKGRAGSNKVATHNGRRITGLDPAEFASTIADMGAGELLINSVDRDGTMTGYDIDLIRGITKSVNIPVIACGGAGNIADMCEVISKGGASSAASGSIFFFYGSLRAVLINYPNMEELDEICQSAQI
jgi:cyclase